MGPGSAKINGNVFISRYFESPETRVHIQANADFIDYPESGLSKRCH